MNEDNIKDAYTFGLPIPTQEPIEWESEFENKWQDGDFTEWEQTAEWEGEDKVKKHLIKDFIQSQIKQAEERVKDKVEKFLKDEYGYKGEYIEPDITKKSHGTCCYCSSCGYTHDDCVCENNHLYNFLSTLINQNNE